MLGNFTQRPERLNLVPLMSSHRYTYNIFKSKHAHNFLPCTRSSTHKQFFTMVLNPHVGKDGTNPTHVWWAMCIVN